ncbi:hypothetical protein NFI96_015967, partial [Prochilodus magdalenae]
GVSHSVDSSVNPSYELKKLERQPAGLELADQPQNFNTIHFPGTMMTSPFLQHPSLTPGQKHYLYTVAEAYSKDHMRKLIRQHYLNVLHRSIRTGVSHTKDINFSMAPELRIYSPDIESPKPLKKSSSGQKPKATSKKRLILPKINSHRKSLPSRFPQESNARKSKLPVRKSFYRSGPVQWKADDDSVLSDISSLSLKSEEGQASVRHRHVNTYL